MVTALAAQAIGKCQEKRAGSPLCPLPPWAVRLLEGHVRLAQKSVVTGLPNCPCVYSSPFTLCLP